MIHAQPFLGTWDNTNVNAGDGSMTRVVITQPNPSTVLLHGYGSCSTGTCDWGETKGSIESAGKTKTPELKARFPVSGGYLGFTATRVGRNLQRAQIVHKVNACNVCLTDTIYLLRQPPQQPKAATPGLP